MRLASVRAGAILLIASLLQSCGGGGGGNGGGEGGQDVRLSVSSRNISVSAEPGDETPRSSVTMTVTNPPEEGLFAGAIVSGDGIALVDIIPTSATQATLQIYFQSPNELQNDTYAGSIELHVCTDDQCANDIDGSPVTIQTSYEVSGGITGLLDRNTIEHTTDSQQDDFHREGVRLTLDRAPFGGAYLQIEPTSNAINFVSTSAESQLVTNIDIEFYNGRSLRPGTYTDTVTITACYDFQCIRQIEGSPFTISTRMIVNVGAEPGFTPLAVASRTALAHDVLDAEYSKALNAVVMVGSYPVNALYIYDVTTDTERQQPLPKLPTAVSVSPDGLAAAVGHDALISVVDLTTAGQPGAPAPTLLNVSIDVLDVMIDARRRVHALPRVDQWQEFHTVDIASNTEKLSTGRLIYAGARGRLHPSGDYIYSIDGRFISPGDIEKWDATSDQVAWVRESPYHGDYAMCGDLWFKEDGATIYTTCGNTFRSSLVPEQDMVYSGALELTDADFGFLISSLSQSDALKEIALIEYDNYYCEIIPDTGPCYTHLALYESDFLNRQAVYAIGPVTVDETTYEQHGLFVFHDANGSQKYMISKIRGAPSQDAEYYLSVIE